MNCEFKLSCRFYSSTGWKERSEEKGSMLGNYGVLLMLLHLWASVSFRTKITRTTTNDNSKSLNSAYQLGYILENKKNCSKNLKQKMIGWNW